MGKDSPPIIIHLRKKESNQCIDEHCACQKIDVWVSIGFEEIICAKAPLDTANSSLPEYSCLLRYEREREREKEREGLTISGKKMKPREK
jgi:hypothetical protein